LRVNPRRRRRNICCKLNFLPTFLNPNPNPITLSIIKPTLL
jgi:hypothetical protein